MYQPLDHIPELLTKRTKKLTIPKNQTILAAETFNEGVYFIVSGKVAVRTYLENGDHIFLKELNQGNCFGEMELFSERRGTYEITALSDVSLLNLPKESVKEWMQADFKLTEYLFEELNDKLIYSSNYIVQQNQGTKYEHLLHYLMRFPENQEFQLKKSELAVTLNTSLRNLNRAFLKGQEAGIFTWENKQLTIIDKEKLLLHLEEVSR